MSQVTTAKKHHYTETYHSDGYVYLGTTNRTHVVIVKPHPKGLSVYSSRQLYERGSRGATVVGRASKTHLVPGQYSLSAIAEWILQLTGDNPTAADKNVVYRNGKVTTSSATRRMRRIKAILIDSGLWEKRGALPWPHMPPRFFSAVKVSDFVLGNTQSYKAWWRTFLYNADHDAQANMRYDIRTQLQTLGPNEPSAYVVNRRAYTLCRKAINTDIQQGVLPAFPHELCGWGKLPLKYLVHAIRRGYITRKQWPTFVDAVLPKMAFTALTKQLSGLLWRSETDEFDRAIAFLAQIDPAVTKSDLRKLSDDNLDFAITSKAHSRTEFQAMIAAVEAYNAAHQVHLKRAVRASYRAPNITLPTGWEFATKRTLSAICGTQPWFYEETTISRHMADGTAHLVANRNAGGQSILGLLRYGESDTGVAKWTLQKVYSQHPIPPRHLMALQGIVNRLNVQCPEPGVPQQQPLRDAYIWSVASESALAQRMLFDYYQHLCARPATYAFYDLFEPKVLDSRHIAYRNPAKAIARLKKLSERALELSGMPF